MKSLFRVAAAFALLAVPTAAWATNGYFTHGYGTGSKGMAGAGSALAIDALAGATNPAAIAFLGSRNDIGVALFNPNRDYTVAGAPSGYPGTFGLAPGNVTSDGRFFPIPYFAASRQLGGRHAAGLMIYGNGGMNTNYRSPTFGSTPTGVDLEQLFVAPTYARRLNPKHALGTTGVVSYQRFAAKGLAAFAPFSNDPSHLTNRGHADAIGGGVRVGYLGQWSRFLSLGVSYQSRIWMRKFDSYAGLFCEGGDFDIPPSWTAAVALKPHPAVDLAVDVQRTDYSEVHSVGHPMLPNLTQQPLGGDGSAGFGWRDITTYKFGAQFRSGPSWTWRGGYSFGDQPIPSSEVLFNILAPGVIQQHATIGLTRDLGAGRGLSLAMMRAFSNTVSGPNPLEAPGQQRIELRMDEWELELGYSWAMR